MRSRKDLLTAIKEDRRRGAYELLSEAIKALMESQDPCSDAEELLQSHPEMAPFIHLKQAACSSMKALRKLEDFLMESRDELSKTCASHLDELKVEVVSTLSRSSSVLNCLSKSSVSKVIVGESRPGYEGVYTAQALAELGIDVVLVVDALLPSISKEEGAVGLIGADRVLINGDVVNKVGSYPLALAVKTHVVAGLLKLVPSRDYPKVLREPEELGHKGDFQVVNLYFERVPHYHLNTIIFEDMVLKPVEVRLAFRKLNSILGT